MAAAAGIAFFVGRLDLARERALAAEAVAQIARAASERDAASARAALDFLTAAFRAAAPETALRRDVSVRSLLDAARASLATRKLDAPATQTMQRLLGRLYAELGERGVAVGLLRAGLAGAIADDRADALRLAADYDLLSGQLSSADDGADSTAAANAADALRARWAPDDTIERIRTLISLATARDRAGDGTRAIALLRQADGLAREHAVTADLAARIAIPFAGALAGNDCNEAETVAASALRRVEAELPRESPQRRQLLAARANALQTCGRWAEAEPLLREAIALQNDVVGPGGGDMMRLTTQLSQLLAQLGRLPEAAALLTQSGATEASDLDDTEVATLLGNRADLLDAAGDYVSSLAASREAAALLDRAGIGADHALRRQLRRNQARTLALVGDYGHAVAELADLRERAARVDGAGSVEYASVVWQLAAAARVAQHAETGMPLLEEAVGLWRQIAPADHPIFAYAERCRAVFAMIQRDYARADAAFAQALRQLEALKVPLGDLATARSERAELWRRQGRITDARALLAQALPVLRDNYLPTQLLRAGAERTAVQLGMR